MVVRDADSSIEVNVCSVYIYGPRGNLFMIRFRPGISILRAFVVAILLFPHAGARVAGEPRALHGEGDVVGAHDPSVINEEDPWYLVTTTPPDSTLEGDALNEKRESNVFLPDALNRLICCPRISTETRNCSYKGDRDDESA
jgi:hypothetical protein